MPRTRELTGLVLDGRYELREVVGEGAFGRVYRSRDRRLDRIVAVKLIKPWWGEDPAWAGTFEREARLLARVSHPGIVQIFDVGQAQEGLYYVAELVDGESLASRLQRGRLNPEEASDLAEQLCRALGSAHGKGIVHRDIKPANVLLSAAGKVKLGDFGVARLADGSTGGPATGVVGTPRYMAPEQARGLKTSPATDVYSVGVVLYEMLNGAPPFAGESAIDVALSHLHDPPPPLPASTPRPLARVAERAMAKDPRDRYRDGHSMAEALARAPTDVRARAIGRRSNGHTHSLGPAAQPDPTRVAPKMTSRRKFNPAARRRSIALLSLAFMVIAAMILGAVLLAAPGHVRVPRLIGLNRAAIVAKVHRMPLRIAFTTRFDPAPAGTAIAESPAPGTRVSDGSAVRIVLSAGPPPVEVPRLAGQTSASARTILESLGLRVSLNPTPAPGVQPGTVTGQMPAAGHYVRPGGKVVVTVAETPSWRPLTSLAGTDGGHSVPFRVRGTQWRVVYRMSYVGTCTFIFFCRGPGAQIIRSSNGSAVDEFGLNDGESQSVVERSGPGVYEVRITPGSDTARWSMEVQDYY